MKTRTLFTSLALLAPPLMAQQAINDSTTQQTVESAVEQVLLTRPEWLLQVLEDNPVRLAELVERAESIRNARAQEAIWLAELSDPKVAKIAEERPIRGNRQAPVTIVEYSDFQCPYCQAASATMHALLADYDGTVRFIYKHNPLAFHSMAEPAARYFEAIALQSEEQAWIFHDRLFEEQQRMDEGDALLQELSEKLDIDQQTLAQDLVSEAVLARLQADRQEAQAFAFDGTPAFLINGVSVIGNQPREVFDDIISLVIQHSSASKP